MHVPFLIVFVNRKLTSIQLHKISELTREPGAMDEKVADVAKESVSRL